MSSHNTRTPSYDDPEGIDRDRYILEKHLKLENDPEIHLDMENCFNAVEQKLAGERGLRGQVRSLATPWRITLIALMALTYLTGLALISHRPFYPPSRIAMLVAVFAVTAMMLIKYALRGPERPRRTWLGYAGLLAWIATLEAWLPGSFGPTFATTRQWMMQGAFCLTYSMLNGLPVTLGLILFDRHDRSAPHRRWVAGGAGATVGLIALALHCPYDEVSHLLTAHTLSVATLVATNVVVIRWMEQRRRSLTLTYAP